MKKLLLSLSGALVLCSCVSERVGFLDPDAIYPHPLGDVLDRHDALVRASVTDPVELDVALGSSAELRKTVEAAAAAKHGGAQ